MPQGRPAIPIEIRREVLFQARHRCAVCCEPTPLEQAHIRPWSTSQDHTEPNLIALCANCHHRADTEEWGTVQLRRYKQEPCALQRDRLPPLSPFQKAMFDLIIGTEPEKMTEKERLRLVSMTAAYVDVRVSAVSVVSVEPVNSTRVRLELPSEGAAKLLAGFQAADKHLQAFLEDVPLLRVEPAASTSTDPKFQAGQIVALAVQQHRQGTVIRVLPPIPVACDRMNNDRQIRLFVSSTFLDMQAERNHLVTVVFPQLRRLCETRGVTWSYVDLRWGVPDEDAAEGKVLPICLEIIDRCRPYFIGLLGERYGSVPQSIPDELLEEEAWLREELTARKSVTELEALHGALRNPAKARHAYFYFRDPDYLKSITEPERHHFASEKPEDQTKLKQLKDRIRQSGLPVRENYPDPKALGELVLADFTAVINQCWPEGSQPDPLTREALDHAAYARSRERVYISRGEYFTRLDAHIADSGDQPLAIIGESGSGKSALLANWASRYRQAHPDALLLEHYIGATPASGDWAAMLQRIMGEFKQRLGLTQDIPDHPDALRSAFPTWLHMVATKGRVIMILDALNQLEDRDGAPDLVWLPPVMPRNVRLIVSTLPGRALNEITRRDWPVFNVGPLTNEERRKLIVDYLAQHAKKLSPPRVDGIANAAQSANPLYLRVLLDEMRIFGVHERLEERIAYYLQAGSPYELYGKVIARWEKDYGGAADLVRHTLSLLWAARRGLTESELLDALGSAGQPLPHAAWSPLFLALADALVSRGGLWTFAHDFLRTATRAAYLPDESLQQQAHLRLGSYFERQPASLRQIEELPWQFNAARQYSQLFSLLADLDFSLRVWDTRPADLRFYWGEIERHSIRRMPDAYSPVLLNPVGFPKYAWMVGSLLLNTPYASQATDLWNVIADEGRAGNSMNLGRALNNLGASLLSQGRPDDAETALNQALDIVDAAGDPEGLVTVLLNHVNSLVNGRHLDHAGRLLNRAERLIRPLQAPALMARVTGSHARILFAQGLLQEALTKAADEEHLCQQLEDLQSLARCLLLQAEIHLRSGNYDRALTLTERSLQSSREAHDDVGVALGLSCRSKVFWHQGMHEEALATLREQEWMSRRRGDVLDLAHCYGHQAMVIWEKWAQSALAEVLELLNKQQSLAKQLNDSGLLQTNLNNRAVVLQESGRLDDALRCLDEKEALSRRMNDRVALATCLGNRAAVFLRRGEDDDLSRAESCLEEKERICVDAGLPLELASCLGNRALVARARGRPEDARAFLARATSIYRQVGNPRGEAISLFNHALLEWHQFGNPQKASRLRESAAALAEKHGLQDLLARFRRSPFS